MQKTTNLGLNKPEYSDVADIADINANMDIIDSKIKEVEAEAKNKNGGNADTVDGKHARDFAIAGHNHSDYVKKNSEIIIGSINDDNDGQQTIINDSSISVVNSCTDYSNSITMKASSIKAYKETGGVIPTISGFEEISADKFIGDGSKLNNVNAEYAEKLRIFDVDGVTLKDTDGTNNLVFASPKQVTKNEAKITGFNTDKYWYNLGITNQTLKVPYSDLAIRALSFGTQAIPADTGMVRNVEGISTSIMNDCKFPVAYITRTTTKPFCPIEGREFHILYFPSTKEYGTQIAISEQAFKGQLKAKEYTARGVEIYMRSGQGRYTFDDESQKTDWEDDGYIVTDNETENEQRFLASDWSDWVKINSASNVPTSAISTSSGSYSFIWGESNIQNILEKLAYQICYTKNSNSSILTNLNNHSGATTNAHTANAISVTAIKSATYGDRTLSTNNSNAQNVFQDLYNRLCYALNRSDECLSELQAHQDNDNGGEQHIPIGGAWNNSLKYSSSGVAVWSPTPYTYSKVSASLAEDTWYKLALCNFYSSDKYGGGTATIRIHAYDGTGKEQNIVCRANYIGGSDYSILNDKTKCNLEVINSFYRGEKLFDKISRVAFNKGFIAFHSAVNVSSLTINITVESSISENRVDFKANDNEWNTTVDGNWVWSHSGQYYWIDYDI